ncbi:MAG: CopG family transcriptional regulator [Gammaproteobacteria bacterium]
MSTTTIRLPDDLKARVGHAAKRAGTTAHNFILDAIAQKTEQAEARSEFEALADARYAEIVATGEAVPWKDMRAYLEARIAGQTPAHPRPRKLV